MVKIKFSSKVIKDSSAQIKNLVKETCQRSVRTLAQDLARTASEATPHFKGDLEGSYSIEYNFGYNRLIGIVEFAVFKGGFNYAIAMHELTYKLGEGSQQKAKGGGGTSMSGKTYPVGNKFLTRVLEGDKEFYHEYMEEQLRKILS